MAPLEKAAEGKTISGDQSTGIRQVRNELAVDSADRVQSGYFTLKGGLAISSLLPEPGDGLKPRRGAFALEDQVIADDLIVNNSATDLRNAKRVTHRVTMRPSTVKRLQILGVYRDIELSTPKSPDPDAVQREKKAQYSRHSPMSK
jgi:hypothetical protein